MQVGQLQRPGENLYKQGALKTMSQVLEVFKVPSLLLLA